MPRRAAGVTQVTVKYTTRSGRRRIYKYWKSRIYVDGRNMALGHYKTREDALFAYQRAQKLYR
jgi:hypothetical protein